ncbi:hypothetical protein N0V83_002746 [Neocucurbitaria cava]|uniref:AA1-like domain-containing protein n=1 Tax=Neocucurbitaria cava TaxID=798079 RepID=A0A9W8YFI5_9PLEO|nr:hypothetical protein N0V83_002746 [Neocucurbitaria cava]
MTPQTTDCPNPAHCGGGAPDPSTYENINIADYTLRKNNGTIQAVYFKLSGNNATGIVCETGAVPTVPSEVVTCGTSDYRFGVVEDPNGGEDTDVGLAIYHQTSPFAGKMGTGSVPTYCRAGGNGPEDYVCQQTDAVATIVIQ